MPPKSIAPQVRQNFDPDAPQNITGAVSYDKAVLAALTDTGVEGVKEVLDYDFYDSTTVATGVTAPTNLFTAQSTDQKVGNWVGQNAMPSGQAFLIQTMSLTFAAGTSGADMVAMLSNLVVELKVENAKLYAQLLGLFIPSGYGVTLEQVNGTTAALATGIGYANNGVTVNNNVLRFRRPVVLRSQQPFSVTLRPGGPTLGATTRVFIKLGGIYVRNVL